MDKKKLEFPKRNLQLWERENTTKCSFTTVLYYFCSEFLFSISEPIICFIKTSNYILKELYITKATMMGWHKTHVDGKHPRSFIVAIVSLSYFWIRKLQFQKNLKTKTVKFFFTYRLKGYCCKDMRGSFTKLVFGIILRSLIMIHPTIFVYILWINKHSLKTLIILWQVAIVLKFLNSWVIPSLDSLCYTDQYVPLEWSLIFFNILIFWFDLISPTQ